MMMMMMEKEQTKVSLFDFDKSLMMMMMEKEQTKVSFFDFDKSLMMMMMMEKEQTKVYECGDKLSCGQKIIRQKNFGR